MRRYYHADLRDLFTGGITVRQVLVWLRQLPRDAASVQAVDPDAAWGLNEQLLAGAVDVLTWANFQRAGGKGPKPKPIERPGVKTRSRRYGRTSLPADQARRILDGYRRGEYAKGGDDGA